MGLREVGEKLPPGFRFYPNDEELVCHYLYKKIANEETLKGTLVEIDLHVCEPWQLPETAKLNNTEWYFFSFRDRKYATGFRTNRATTSGYWKATGKDRVIQNLNTREIVGMRKTLVFYRNRAPNGIKTGWIMHEFRLEIPHMPPKEDWVLCRVFHKGKGENNTDNNYQIFDNEMTNTNNNNNSFSPPTLSTQQNTHQTCKCQQLNPSNYPLTTSLNPNKNPNKEDCSSSFAFSDLINPSAKNGEDDFGFLWDDMDLEDTSNNKLGGESSHDFLSTLLNPQFHHHFGI